MGMKQICPCGKRVKKCVALNCNICNFVDIIAEKMMRSKGGEANGLQTVQRKEHSRMALV